MFSLSMFPYFTFSCLGCTLEQAESAVRAFPEEDPNDSFQLGHYSLEEIFHLKSDGRAYPKGGKGGTSWPIALLFAAPANDKTIVMSNLIDGWVTLCNDITSRLRTDVYTFAFSDEDNPDARNALTYIDWPTGKERVVYAMKDPRWKFCEIGEPLSFEDVSNYKHPRVKDRLTRQIMISYCNRLGLNVEDPDFLNPHGTVLRVQHTW